MGGYPQVWESGHASLAAPVTITLGPGDTSATYSRELINDLGGAESAGAMTGVRLKLEVKVAGVWVSSGAPVLDDGWASMRATGVYNDGDATFGPYTTGSKRIGSFSDFVLPDIPEDCGILFDLIFFAPSDITTAAIEFRLVPLWDQNAVALASQVANRGGGVVPGYRDTSIRRVATGREIITAGTDSITVERGTWDYDGTRGCSVRSAHTLNQNDSVPSALTAGQSYIAAITQNSAGVVTVTKGTRSTTPTAPALPANHIFLRWATVTYQVGGTSVINDGDLSGTFIRGDYMVEAASGLNVYVHSGRALYDTSVFGFHDIRSTVAVTASITNYIWARPDGNFSASATEVTPITGAQLLAEADADGSAVTAVRSRAVPLDIAIDEIPLVISLGTVTGTSSAPLDWTVAPFDCEISRVRLEAGANAGGAANSWVAEVGTAAEGEPTAGTWSTIYTSSGSDDQRPQLLFSAIVLANESIFHEVRRVAKGARIGAWMPAIPAGGTLTGAKVIVYVRRSR